MSDNSYLLADFMSNMISTPPNNRYKDKSFISAIAIATNAPTISKTYTAYCILASPHFHISVEKTNKHTPCTRNAVHVYYFFPNVFRPSNSMIPKEYLDLSKLKNFDLQVEN